MFSYFYEDGFYKVHDRSGLIHAAFTTEWEAVDFCNRHNEGRQW